MSGKRFRVLVREVYMLEYFVQAESQEEIESEDFDFSDYDPTNEECTLVEVAHVDDIEEIENGGCQ